MYIWTCRISANKASQMLHCLLIIFHIPAFTEPDEFIYTRWQIAMLIYQDQIKDIYDRIRIS